MPLRKMVHQSSMCVPGGILGRLNQHDIPLQVFHNKSIRRNLPQRHAIIIWANSCDEAAVAMGGHQIRHDVDVELPFGLVRVTIRFVPVEEIHAQGIGSKGVGERDSRLLALSQANLADGFLPGLRDKRAAAVHNGRCGGSGGSGRDGINGGFAYNVRHVGLKLLVL